MEKQLEIVAMPKLTKPIEQYIRFFDIDLARKSNVSVFGFGGSGKTCLAVKIASILQKQNFYCVTMDNVGVWKWISDIPLVQVVNSDTQLIGLPTQSIIYDLSGLYLEQQKEFISNWIELYRKYRQQNPAWTQNTLVTIEEAQTVARRLDSLIGQQVYWLATVGRNEPYRTRLLCISPRISNLSTDV